MNKLFLKHADEQAKQDRSARGRALGRRSSNLRTDVVSVATFIARILVAIWFYRLTVRRVRDTGHQKSVAYLACLPVVNIVFFLYLLFPSSKADVTAAKALE